MSGGHFNRHQNYIRDIADDIQIILDSQGKEITDPWDNEQKYCETYPEDVQQIFRDGVTALKRAYIYAQRIDWYLSGDDGEESLKERLKEELQNLDNGKDI